MEQRMKTPCMVSIPSRLHATEPANNYRDLIRHA